MIDPHEDKQSLEIAFIEGRYPWTYCADQIRHWMDGGSRSDAARTKRKIAEAIGMKEVDLARAIADVYLRENGIKKPEEKAPA